MYSNDIYQATRQLVYNMNFADPERAYNNLLGVFWLESRFNPQAKNPNSSATGLIQFMDATASELGTTTAALRQMNISRQMEWVEKYLRKNNVLKYQNTDVDYYLTIFYPASRGKDLSYTYPSWVYNSNKGFDTDKSGTVTKSEISNFFEKKKAEVKNRADYVPFTNETLTLVSSNAYTPKTFYSNHKYKIWFFAVVISVILLLKYKVVKDRNAQKVYKDLENDFLGKEVKSA